MIAIEFERALDTLISLHSPLVMRHKIILAVDTVSFHLLPRSIWTAQSVKECGLGRARRRLEIKVLEKRRVATQAVITGTMHCDAPPRQIKKPTARSKTLKPPRLCPIVWKFNVSIFNSQNFVEPNVNKIDAPQIAVGTQEMLYWRRNTQTHIQPSTYLMFQNYIQGRPSILICWKT